MLWKLPTAKLIMTEQSINEAGKVRPMVGWGMKPVLGAFRNLATSTGSCIGGSGFTVIQTPVWPQGQCCLCLHCTSPNSWARASCREEPGFRPRCCVCSLRCTHIQSQGLPGRPASLPTANFHRARALQCLEGAVVRSQRTLPAVLLCTYWGCLHSEPRCLLSRLLILGLWLRHFFRLNTLSPQGH